MCKFCADNGIILYSLLSNATHILQPADVAVFRSLKNNWKKAVFDWKRQNNNKALLRVMFSSLLENAVSSVTKETVENGFCRCGIFPFDANVIDYTKCMSHASRVIGNASDIRSKPSEFKIEHLFYLESTMKNG